MGRVLSSKSKFEGSGKHGSFNITNTVELLLKEALQQGSVRKVAKETAFCSLRTANWGVSRYPNGK